MSGTVCAMRRGLVFYANYNSGWRVLMVGGNYSNSTGNVGLFNFNANNSSSDTNSNVGARLLVFLFDWRGLSLTAW